MTSSASSSASKASASGCRGCYRPECQKSLDFQAEAQEPVPRLGQGLAGVSSLPLIREDGGLVPRGSGSCRLVFLAGPQ